MRTVRYLPKQAVAVGTGGAVASGDVEATSAGLEVLRPAERVARQGFGVDATFREQVRENAARFAQFSSTSKLFLPGGQLPVVGSIFRNPQLAST